MTSYKDFERVYLGESDVAAITAVGINPNPEENSETSLLTKIIKFGEDGSYEAYLTHNNWDDVEIGEHYSKVAEFKSWAKFYDDGICRLEIYADKVEVFRAGKTGCIIHADNLHEYTADTRRFKKKR